MSTSHFIVLPGGGYAVHGVHEAEPVAGWIRSLGIEASVFRYPVQTRHPDVLQAVRGEIRRIRSVGAERVGLVGFSAGGHAAGMAALCPEDDSTHVDTVILGYPVVSMESYRHPGSSRRLIGTDPSPELSATTSLNRLVTKDAPPFFIWHTADDESVAVQHSYLLGCALATHSVPHELHVFQHGPHGLGLALGDSGVSVWTGLAVEWLRQHRWIPYSTALQS